MSNELTTTEISKVDLIYMRLEAFGIYDKIKIDDGIEDVLLSALTRNNIDTVSIDEEGGLVIEYKGDDE